MKPFPFDPFRDRLSRDIRNELSASLLRCLSAQSLAPARQIADRFLADDPGPEQVAYIGDRLERYGRFLVQVAEGPDDALWRSLVLWDLGLLFEVHEILEHAWLRAEGTEKSFLQAMIRAAGVYIKGEFGFAGSAAKMAARALPVLAANRDRLAPYIDPEQFWQPCVRRRWRRPGCSPDRFSGRASGQG